MKKIILLIALVSAPVNATEHEKNCQVTVPHQCQEIVDSTFSLHHENIFGSRYVSFIVEIKCLVNVNKEWPENIAGNWETSHDEYKVFLTTHIFDMNEYLKRRGFDPKLFVAAGSSVIPDHINFKISDSVQVKKASLTCTYTTVMK